MDIKNKTHNWQGRKHSEESKRKISESNKKYSKENPRTHTEETKKKLSEIRKKYLDENPDKVPYRLYHTTKQSYPEKTFEKYLRQHGVKGWIYNYPFNKYTFDFAFPEWKLDIEIDGNTHNSDKVKNIDKERDEYTISQGWKVIRFKASDIRNNVYDCINKVLTEISHPKLMDIPKEFLNKKLEKHLKNEQRKQKQKVKNDKQIEREINYINTINEILNQNENKFGIVQIIADKLNITHTSVRRICKRNNIEIHTRDNNKVINDNETRLENILSKGKFVTDRIDTIKSIIAEYGYRKGLLTNIAKYLKISRHSVTVFCDRYNIKLKQ